MRRLPLYIVVLPLFLGAALRAQTSQPAPVGPIDPPAQLAPESLPAVDPWTRAARALAAALVKGEDGGARAAAPADPLAGVLPTAAAIRRFDSDEPQDRSALRRATAGAVVVSVLSYTNGPLTVATDLALDIREAAFLPESIRNEFTIEGETAIRRANETAGQWVTGTLQPGVQQPVALIALWQPSQATMTFVLLKGRETAAGEHRVTYVVYGNVEQIVP